MEEDPACCVLAGGAMSKLAAKLDGLGRRRHMPIPWEVKNELIPLIKKNLEIMMAIIQDNGDDNSSRAVIRCLTKEVRELSYDIHDCIDEHAAGPASDHATRLLWRMVRHVRVARANEKRRRSTVVARRRTSSKPIQTWLSERLKGRLWLLDKMREFSARSAEALHRYNSFNRPLKKQRNGDNHGDSSTKAIATRSGESFGSWSPPSNAPLLHRRVGIHDLAMNTLKAWLTDGDSPKLKVVSIVGCGGLGKTTLANELYRGVGGQFECRAFVRTSQKPDVRRLLIDILSQIRPKQPPGNWKVHNLIGDIRTHLQDKRYLIVIDDVWARSTWDIVNRAFPDGNHCSRILITSELEDVALNCCGYESQYVYKIKPLSEDDSRKLFYSIVGFPQELSGVSNSVISKCGGLPLAIVVIASLLASRMGKPEQREYVEYVDKSLGYGLMTNPTLEGMKQVVNLSYRFLPQHLKACMLYLCIFPEDYIIWTDDLLKQWIAEGFICATEGQDEMEISRGYFEELISSRLIQAIHIDGNDKVLSCTMHHMMRNHIMQESIVENFVAVIDYSQTATRFAQKVRRLSLHFGNAEDTNLSSNMRLSQVRTLAFFGAFKCVPSITEFRLLQILILHIWGEEESIKFDLTSISEIFRLRYLQVTCNVTLEIQQMQMLRRLQYLETLKIDAARGSKISSDVVHLPRLLHLRLPAETNLPGGISRMISLRTLGHFDLSTNSIERVRTLGELTNVQDLQLTCTPMGPSHYLVKQMECLSSVLGKLNNLKCLTLKNSRVVDHGRRPSSMSISCDVLSSVPSPPALLQRLEWLPRVCTFSNLPEWIDHLGKLCILKIGVREIVRNDVDLLKGLPALTVLSLYVHKKPTEIIVFSKGGFLVLKYLGFRCSIPCLKFEVDVMPNLRKLKLGFDADGAIQYGPIPAGLDHLSGLKEISAKIGGASANEQVRRIVESALSDATRMHTGRPTVNIQCVDQMFGDKDDQNIRLQEEKHMTPQKQYGPIEEDSNKQHITLQKGFREDAVSRYFRPDFTLPLAQRDITSLPSSAPSSTSSSGSGPSSTGALTPPNSAGSAQPAPPPLAELERVRRIGSGAGGTVWMVRHAPTGQLYALKVLHGHHDDAVRRQIEREIAILRTAEHPAVVRCHGMYEQASELQILLEYMDGGSLEGRRIASEAFLSEVARQVLSGIAYLHRRHIVHRDIKPSNLLMDSGRRVKIADFGVGRILNQIMDACNSSVDTIAYMSPERINTDLNDSAYDGYAGDIWSFGLSILEFYLGRFPLGENLGKLGDWAALMCAICYDDSPAVPPTASPELKSFISCCLQKNPARRPSAAQLLQHRFIAGPQPGSHRCSLPGNRDDSPYVINSMDSDVDPIQPDMDHGAWRGREEHGDDLASLLLPPPPPAAGPTVGFPVAGRRRPSLPLWDPPTAADDARGG